MERATREVAGTKQSLEFRGFKLEHDRGSEDLILYNAQNPMPKLAMPVETLLLIARQVDSSGWLPRRNFRDATSTSDPALQNTGS
jgi:hypothetical protein